MGAGKGSGDSFPQLKLIKINEGNCTDGDHSALANDLKAQEHRSPPCLPLGSSLPQIQFHFLNGFYLPTVQQVNI